MLLPLFLALSLIVVQLGGIPGGSCENPWVSSGAQVISGDPVVAAGIGPLNRDAFARMSNGTQGQDALNQYFRSALGRAC